jgi:hypothetical protein
MQRTPARGDIEGGAAKPDLDLEPAAIARAGVLASALRAVFTVDATN